MIAITSDLGTGKVTANYTLGSALIQAYSYAIYHFASVGFIINSVGVELPDEGFGYNPNIPKIATVES